MSEEKSVTMCSIGELLNYNFVIPSYQRGYRWDEIQVNDLLNDIYEFHQNNNEGFYCLQPLVLKNISDEKISDKKILDELKLENKDNVYEVIDGQQRLTTIYLILKYLKKEEIFNIIYTTRLKNKEDELISLNDLFEKNENIIKENKIDNIDNIDFEYIKTSYEVIKKWFESNKENKGKDENKSIEEIIKYILLDGEKVKFIWYEPKPSDNANPIEIFTRINIGKIPLTNSELIKALFLQKANFIQDENFDKALYEHTQIEIASEWDYIENTLQDDRFWGFINNDMNKKYNRIDYIFEIVSDKLLEKDKQDKKISEENLKEIGEDGYKTFRYFYKKWKDNKDKKDNEKKMSFMEDTWKEIRYCFYAMNKWYNDLIFYHYIGFLIHCDNKENNILNLYNSYIGSTKENFKTDLIRRIKEIIIKKINYEIIDKKDKKEISFNIKYDSTDKEIIRNFLLLYNIEYMLKNQSSNAKFPFDLFKKQKWDIEHIESQTPQSTEEKEEYIENILNIKNINTYYNLTNFTEIFENYKKNKNNENIDIWDKFINIFYKENNNKENDDEEFKNSLGNLTLLDSSTNRGYGNAFFVIKRKIILEKDKNSYFIPIGTKNVFLKYFDDDISVSTVHRWTKNDASKYEEDISKTLKKFFLPNKEDKQ